MSYVVSVRFRARRQETRLVELSERVAPEGAPGAQPAQELADRPPVSTWRKPLTLVQGSPLSLVWVATALVLIGGAAACVHLGDQVRFTDEREYLSIGQNLADRGQFSLNGTDPTAYRTPGYPMIIAGARTLGVGLAGIRFVNFVFVALTIWAVYALTRSFASRTGAVLAALGVSAYPLLLFTASTFYPQAMATLLLVTTLWAASRALQSSGHAGTAWAAGAGLSVGLLMMVVPTFAFVAVLLLAWLAWTRRSGWAAVCVPLAVAALALPVGWTVRNAVVFHHFIPLTTSSGFNLLVGNNPTATASSGYNPQFMAPYEGEARRRGLDEVQTDAYYRRAATEWIRAHPGRAIGLYAGKLLNNFSWSNKLTTSSQNSALRSAVGALSFIPLLVLLLARLLMVRRRRLQAIEWLMLAIIVLNALLLAIYTTRVRYRLPVDMLMISIVAAFAASVVKARLRRAAGAG